MQKKLLVVALAGAFAAPFAAQAADNVTVYGQFWAAVQGTASKGATEAGRQVNQFLTTNAGNTANLSYRNQVTCSSCALGFRGTEDLGGGLKAWFQMESTYNIDGEPGSGFGGRNSGVGLTGNWGTLMMGQWDTPYKRMNIEVGTPFYSTTAGSYNAIIGSPGFGVGSTTAGSPSGTAPDAAFDRRQRNSIQYWTPTWNGLKGSVAYSTNEGKSSQSGATPGRNPYIFSAQAQYRTGNLAAGVAYEYHNDFNGLRVINGGAANTFADGEDYGVKAQVNYKIQGKYVVGVLYEHLSYESKRPGQGAGALGAANLKEYDRDAFGALAILPVGPGKIHANIIFANKGDCEVVGGGTCDAGGTQGYIWGVGYFYPLSKRSELYAMYAQMENANGNRFLIGAGSGERLGGGFGGDPYSVALGMRHVF